MTKENWINGVGIDAYGDYYQQYRDIAAVLRTGPQRVTNTAHNIFLDVSTGSGLLAGLAFLLIFAITLRVIFSMLKTGNFTATDVAIAGIFIGFVIFCLISINQIGVGIWGFIFMGYLQGWNGRQKNGYINRKLDQERSISKKFVPKPTLNVMPKMSTAIFGVLGLTLTLMPNITDVQMLSAVKSKNYDVMLEVVSKSSATQAHKDRYLNSMLEEGREIEAYEFALKALQSNPRSELALRVIGSHQGAPKSLRITSLEQLIKQDPNNEDLKRYIRGLINELDQ